MSTQHRPSIEEQFHLHEKKKERGFLYTLTITLLIFIGTGLFFRTVQVVSIDGFKGLKKIRTSFMIPKEKEKPKPKPKPKPLPPKKKVYDLTENPVLKATEDLQKEEPKKKPKPIYGVKTVYSKGLGSGGSMDDAVVGKRGNTTNKNFDTVSATDSDVLGEIAAAVTVTQAPAFKKRVKPKITPEIKKSGISGVIRVKVLVDVDGKVKKAIATNDLGFGTKEEAVKACLQMEFTPALREKDPVAVWIIIPVRFEKLG